MTVRKLALILVGLVAVVVIPADSAAAVEVVKDGGFESTPASEDNPNWDEGWIVFSPICDPTCTENDTGGGTVGPHSGTRWVWFGGNAGPEEQFVSQPVTIPPGTATLTFWLWLGASSGNGLDAFRVYMDDTKLFEVLESSTEYGSYKLVTVDVSAYAGVSGAQTLSFEYAGFGPAPTNFSLDDISLLAGTPVAKTVTLKGPKSVAQGKKAKLKVTVAPCAGHEGDTIELYRGKKRIATAASDNACAHTFKVKIKKTASYVAVSPKQDDDHLAGTSKKLKVRAR